MHNDRFYHTKADILVDYSVKSHSFIFYSFMATPIHCHSFIHSTSHSYIHSFRIVITLFPVA